MSVKTSGILDIPLQDHENDKLQILSFEMALNEFVRKTSTPISIALQGEWGSGKTSLMNRLNYEICKNENATSYGIWLNTWHYALLKNKDDILEEIIFALINEVLAISKNEYPDKFKTLAKDIYKIGRNIFKGISKIAVKTAVSQVNSELANAVEETVFSEKEDASYSLNDLKNKLSDLVSQLMQRNTENAKSQKSIIFFIDDLDRIEPALAVNILELLKNIFDIEHCIFMLAIDYDVVVKGLKHKFGELNEQNEREFRSFFDKIIQLPFQMPIASYNIIEYIKDLLESVDYITETEAKNDGFTNSLVRFTNLTVGANPRSIKRLVNTLSFVNLLIRAKSKLENREHAISSDYKQIIYALTCLQSAFPDIFNLLTYNPNIENWNFEFARKKNIEVNEHNSLIWEGIIVGFCNKTEYLKRNSYNIISIIKEMQIIAENNHRKLHEILPETVELLSVTNIKSDKIRPKLEINEIRVLYALNQRLLPAIEQKLAEPLKFIERKGRMIAKITYKFDEQTKNNSISLSVSVKHNSIYLKVGASIELFAISETDKDVWQIVVDKGKTEVFNQLSADFLSLEKKYQQIKLANTTRSGLSLKNSAVYLDQNFQVVAENAEYLYAEECICEISSFVVDYMILLYKINELNWQTK
jgi:gas vesicle protein